MSIAGYYLLVSLFCAFFSLLRFGISLGLLERPLVVGLVWAIFTGEWAMSMSIAIFFELAWLDLIPVGTFIPPHLTAATISALALANIFGMTLPGEILVAILVSLPLAWLGTRLEARFRTYHTQSYDAAMYWLESDFDRPFPDNLIWRALGCSFLVGFMLFFLVMLMLHGAVWLVFPRVASFLIGLKVTWAHLWLGASLGGLLALRLRRAYAVFASGLGLVTILTIASLL